MFTLPEPVKVTWGTMGKDGGPLSGAPSVLCDHATAVNGVDAPHLLVSVRAAPLAEAVTGDAAVELNVFARDEASELGELAYVVDKVKPSTETATYPWSPQYVHVRSPLPSVPSTSSLQSVPKKLRTAVPVKVGNGTAMNDGGPLFIPSPVALLWEDADIEAAEPFFVTNDTILPAVLAVTGVEGAELNAVARADAMLDAVELEL
jgi:hypothetical protein